MEQSDVAVGAKCSLPSLFLGEKHNPGLVALSLLPSVWKSRRNRNVAMRYLVAKRLVWEAKEELDTQTTRVAFNFLA